MQIDCKCVGMLTAGRWGTKIDYMRRVYDPEGLCPTIATVTGGGMEIKIFIKQATKGGSTECCDGGVANLSYPNSDARRGRVIGGSDSPYDYGKHKRIVPTGEECD